MFKSLFFLLFTTATVWGQSIPAALQYTTDVSKPIKEVNLVFRQNSSVDLYWNFHDAGTPRGLLLVKFLVDINTPCWCK
jgi:hypothetical protein